MMHIYKALKRPVFEALYYIIISDSDLLQYSTHLNTQESIQRMLPL